MKISAVASELYQASTCGSGLRLRISEITFVSSR